MIRWEVEIARVNDYRGELEELLDAGWEPFSAYSQSVYEYVALRRPRPASGESIEREVDRALEQSR